MASIAFFFETTFGDNLDIIKRRCFRLRSSVNDSFKTLDVSLKARKLEYDRRSFLSYINVKHPEVIEVSMELLSTYVDTYEQPSGRKVIISYAGKPC